MLKSHSNSHINLAEEIVTNVEKHLEERCRKLEETIASERNINKKNIACMEELKTAVKKADERTRKINESMIEKGKEMVIIKDSLGKVIVANEIKRKEIEKLKLSLDKKDEELKKKKDKQAQNDNAKHQDDINTLSQKLAETRDLCVEYKNKLENLKKDNQEEVAKITTEKMKVEEELRSAVLEKNLLRDSERILLNTFDTLRMHYDARKGKEDEVRSGQNEETFNCDKCNFKTNIKDQLQSHVVNIHEVHTLEKCKECDYKTPFIVNLKMHMDEVHSQPRPANMGETGGYNQKENNGKKYCRYWNRGYCQHDNGCVFLHEDAPECYYGDRCSNKWNCSFFHEDLFRNPQPSAFLGQGNQFYQNN